MTGTQYAFLDLGLFFGGLIGLLLWDKARLDRIRAEDQARKWAEAQAAEADPPSGAPRPDRAGEGRSQRDDAESQQAHQDR